jgi:hypothetical protein
LGACELVEVDAAFDVPSITNAANSGIADVNFVHQIAPAYKQPPAM